MGDTDFFKTGMGRQFYGRDVPAMVDALERIAGALEAIRQQLQPGPQEGPQAAGAHGQGCPCPACLARKGEAIRAIREAAMKAGWPGPEDG